MSDYSYSSSQKRIIVFVKRESRRYISFWHRRGTSQPGNLIYPGVSSHKGYEVTLQVERRTSDREVSGSTLARVRIKSAEIVFVRPRSRAAVSIPPSEVPGIARVEFVKALGVTIGRKFSVSAHVTELLTNCARPHYSLYEHTSSTVCHLNQSTPGDWNLQDWKMTE